MPGLRAEDNEHVAGVRPLNGAATNVAELARQAMARHPDRAAFVWSGRAVARSLSFGELAALVDRFRDGLEALKLPREARVLVLAPPKPDIYALALATLDAGHTLVTVDGRMDRSRIRRALGEAGADVIVGAPNVMRWWPFVGALRRARRFTAGPLVFGTRGIDELRAARRVSGQCNRVDPGSAAVISFSSGNTGHPKRVVRSHAVLASQHWALLAAFPLPDSDVNLPGFPLAVLHNLCRATTTALPAVDLRSMSEADTATVLQTIRDHGVTSISAAPAFIARIASHLLARRESLRHIRRVVVGGGPVSRRLAKDVLTAFPLADARIVYGSTEAEPIATAPLHAIVESDPAADGYLAGWPVDDVEIRLDGARGLGELLVRGPHVVHTHLGDGWCRTGDICRVDDRGCLWLVGRIGAEIRRDGRTIHPFVVESHVVCQPDVVTAALVAHRAAPRGELVVEIAAGADQRTVIGAARATLVALDLAELPVRVVDSVPMDARHHSKVDRAGLVRKLEREVR